MSYPGLPNWGYGAQIPVETLLQLLPFDTLPKRISKEQLAQLQAQTKTTTEQGRLFGAQADEAPLEGFSQRELRAAQARNLGFQAEGQEIANKFAPERERAGIKDIRATTKGRQATTTGQWLQNAFFPAQAAAGLAKTGAEIQDIGASAQDRSTLATANAAEAGSRGAYYDALAKKAGDSDLEMLFNAVQAFAGLQRFEPVLDAKGRPVIDKKTGRPAMQALPLVTGDMVMPVLQQLLSKFQATQAGAPIPVDPDALSALHGAMGQPTPAQQMPQMPQEPPPTPTDPAVLNALMQHVASQPQPQQPFRFTPIQEPPQQPIQRFGPTTQGTNQVDPIIQLLQRLGQSPLLQQFGPLVNR